MEAIPSVSKDAEVMLKSLTKVTLLFIRSIEHLQAVIRVHSIEDRPGRYG
jgi:hypothetical protein